MRFDIGESVVVKSSEKTGTVKQWKHEMYKHNEKEIETRRYLVNFGSYSNDWIEEDDLISRDDMYDSAFESGLLKLLIDVNLKVKNLEVVKWLHSEMKKLNK